MQLQPGTYLQGDKYRITRCLGNGGFGITYLAEHELAGRNVCIKEFFPKEYYNRDNNSCSILLGSKGSEGIMEAYKAKFMKEAKTIARLNHPNIIHIFDVFAENNTGYYVMEYIDGESLGDLVKRKGALSEVEAVKYIRAVAEALGYIHDRKIMHLDIKPANVMVNKEDGQVIVIDFGLSKQYDAEGNQTSSTPVGISAGYAPMEQYLQGGVKEFSPETDIYSLGATLYHLVTGSVPPQAMNIADEGLPKLPAHLSSGVCNAIEHSMEIKRKRRPHSIKEFLALLGDNTPKVVATPKSSATIEETVIGAQAAVVNEQTAISTPQTKAGVPKVTPRTNSIDKKNISLKTCKECSRTYSNTLDTCPHCGFTDSPKVTIYGYTESFAIAPSVDVYIGGRRVANVKQNGIIDLMLSSPSELTFKCNMRSAKCFVHPGDAVVLSFNRVTGGLSATRTNRANAITTINENMSKDNSRWLWIVIFILIGIALSFFLNA